MESAEGPIELNIHLMLIASLLAGCSRHEDEHAAGAAGMSTSSSGRPPQRPADCKARQAAKEPKTVAQYQIVPGDGAGWRCLGDKLDSMRGCESQGTSVVCRRFPEADESVYENGVLTRIRVHRQGRVVPKSFEVSERSFRSPLYRIDFSPPLGVSGRGPTALDKVLATLPAPLSTTPSSDPDFGPIVRYVFPGLELEAEKVDGKDVVGAVVVVEN